MPLWAYNHRELQLKTLGKVLAKVRTYLRSTARDKGTVWSTLGLQDAFSGCLSVAILAQGRFGSRAVQLAWAGSRLARSAVGFATGSGWLPSPP